AGLYRSDDHGAKWELVSNNRELIHRPWYYCHVFADPQDEETVYILNLKMWKSTDGGKQWTEITTPHGDNHDLWIDPANPHRMVQGNDGGACVSLTGGASWSTIYNQCTAQFYHVTVDNQYPYRVYGTQQDNSSISVPSATEQGCIPWNKCYAAGTGESGYIAVNPDDHNIVFVGAVGSSPGGGGALQRYDHRTKQIHIVSVWPDLHYGMHPKEMKYRFPWTFPILYSPHDSGIVYACGNHVFRTTNEGRSWEEISPDLTRNDKSKQNASGGPLTLDTSGAEIYGTIFAFAESPHEPGVFWAGSDDGLVHISRDGGASWQQITPPDLPELALISLIEPSPHDAATAYLAATMVKLDDYGPYLYKTSDYGQTWQRIDQNYPQDELTRVIREDPQRPGLLYVGSETGLFVSFDEGQTWTKFSGNFPVVPVYDLKIKDDDLVVASHGRGFWILDDVTPLREYDPAAGNTLFQPRDTIRRWQHWSVNMFGTVDGNKNYMITLGGHATYINEKDEYGVMSMRMIDAGTNPPYGVILYYTLTAEPSEPISLTIKDSAGNEIKTFTSKPADPDPEKEKEQTDPYIAAEAGLNRFVWNMGYPDAVKLKDPLTERNRTGPTAAPGQYTAALTVGDETHTVAFEIVPDPRSSASQADYEAQFALWSAVRDKVSDTHTAVKNIRTVKEQVSGWQKRAAEAELTEIQTAAEALLEKLNAIEGELVQKEAKTGFDRLRLPAKLNAKLMNVISVIASADEAPTQQAQAIFEQFAAQVDDYNAQLQTIMNEDVQAFNGLVQKAAVPAITV
ncbi:MAG: hypothetical protein KDE51_18460, partial [Anaerolineales bacterium]|nr:hypothetical protein [Anaerolineales bacterium]